MKSSSKKTLQRKLEKQEAEVRTMKARVRTIGANSSAAAGYADALFRDVGAERMKVHRWKVEL